MFCLSDSLNIYNMLYIIICKYVIYVLWAGSQNHNKVTELNIVRTMSIVGNHEFYYNHRYIVGTMDVLMEPWLCCWNHGYCCIHGFSYDHGYTVSTMCVLIEPWIFCWHHGFCWNHGYIIRTMGIVGTIGILITMDILVGLLVY